MVYLRDVPDANHLLGYYPDSVDTFYDAKLKATFKLKAVCDPNTFE